MDHASRLMLVAGALLAAGVLSSRLSARSGLPVALLFVLIGLLAGEEGPLGVPFSDAALASGVSIVLLALILFDGGLSTPADQIRRAAGPAITLATLGVVVSAALVAATAVLALGFSWQEGLLLGSILGSTDAAAVFAVFRGRGRALPGRLQSILEAESGLNDPIAVFLTLTLTTILLGSGPLPTGWEVGAAFVKQMAIGTATGLVTGVLASRVMRNLHLDFAGLYLVLSLAAALLAFGCGQVLGGSGFIAVYIAGVMVGEARLPFERGIRRFHDGLAWIAQVGVFVLLGLLAFPSQLVAQATPGMTIAAALMIVARPVAVLLSTAPFALGWRERLLLTCGGLRGAVPVILATIPMAAGVPNASTIFHLVFFAVLVSVLVQGTALAPLARRLGLERPYRGEAPVSLELTALRETGQELLGYRVEPGSAAAGKAIRALPMPPDALVTLVVRGQDVIPPRGSTLLKADDQVYVLHSVTSAAAVAALFPPSPPDDAALPAEVAVPFPLDARLTTLADIEAFYGVTLAQNTDQILAEWLEDQNQGPLVPGNRVTLAGIELIIVSVLEGRAHMVGVEVRESAD